MLVIALVGRERAAAAQMELAADEVERVAQGGGMDERPVVARAVVLLEAGEGEARDGVVQVDLEHEEALVVAEADIVTGMKFLDEFAFEQQRLRLVADDVDIEIMDGLGEGLEFGVPAEAAGGLEILAHAPLQVARLPHVNDRAEAVLHQVDAGFVGQFLKFFSDEGWNRHGGNFAQRRENTKKNLRFIRVREHLKRFCRFANRR